MKFIDILNIFIHFIFMIALMIIPAEAQVTPTDEWVCFYGRNSLFHGKPIPIGTIIDAYDPNSVHCGSFTVTSPGQYGFLFVYRDNFLTEDIDEGAEPGDTIKFKINGVWAKTFGPDTSVWTQKGDILEVDIADNLPPIQISEISFLSLLEDAPDTMIADLDEVYIDPDGDSLQFAAVTDQSSIIPFIDENNCLHLSLQPNWSGAASIVIVTQDLWFESHDTIIIQVKEINDPPIILGLPDTSFSCNTSLILDLNNYVIDVDHPKSSLLWQAEVQPPYHDSLTIEIDNVEKTATFRARYSFNARVTAIFKVYDDSLGFDRDSMRVWVKFPSAANQMDISHLTMELWQNFPNPFNEITTISYSLAASANVKLEIYNPLGEKISTLISQQQPAGEYSIQWKAQDLSSGVYLMVLCADSVTIKRKLLLIK
ncbi:MAG: T9SS type A sorting domain-containing protein [candidate division KSB1 bacterium]|nr:T9SS type A sorting domain-containing protein [candidate division KSB1 bacterium]MDZ7356952.1 T9SS type A sorting domain-containing protein [candidate division KSB1 bacterium]